MQATSLLFVTLCMICLVGLLLLPNILERRFSTRTYFKSLTPPVKTLYKDDHMLLPLISTTAEANKRHILIFIGIMSAPSRKDRRDAIRKTWLTRCKKEFTVCLFFSDNQDWYGQPLVESVTKPLLEESKVNGHDLILANSPGGINFSTRYLWMVEYALERFEFDYFLRIDDDHFLCIDRLLWELPQRPKSRLVWGYQHCVPGIVRVDEGLHLTSADVVKEFISKKDTLLCHPYGDQAISLWLNDMQGIIYFADNARVYHSVAANNPGLKKRSEICHSYLSLHGSYPADMSAFWQIVSKEPTNGYTLSPVVDGCKLSKTFRWQTFSGFWYAKPLPCKDNPTWQKGRMFAGRAG